MLQAKLTFKQKTFATCIAVVAVFATISSAQSSDYDAEAETSVAGLSGLGGMSGLTALANGILPVVSGDMSGDVEEASGDGERGGDSDSAEPSESSDGSESSSADSGDYEDGANDSAASEEHPMLSKFISLIGRKKRSVSQIEAPTAAETSSSKSTLHRFKRHYKGWVPYVKTYVKTDKKAHFKWGVKTKVGKKYGK